MFSLGHISDLHATPVVIASPLQLWNKRLSGWLSWQLRRKQTQQPAICEALIADLRQAAPHHVVVTGDLTNLSLESEFPAACAWLERLGSAQDVSLVPGNHDAYVDVPQSASWGLWADYWRSDDGAAAADGTDPRDLFPTLRVRGPLAVVGLCSAIPTPVFDASGTLGEAQLERLEALLTQLADSDLCRVVSVHHPITEKSTHVRRELRDAEALRAVLRRTGADLVVHGHNHRTLLAEVDAHDHPIPVVGVRSASHSASKSHKRAQYHLYDFERRAADAQGGRFRITLRFRGYDPATGSCRADGERELVSA
jgi:3',5'-cyclic AMP phosphodiesterase CpdA